MIIGTIFTVQGFRCFSQKNPQTRVDSNKNFLNEINNDQNDYFVIL